MKKTKLDELVQNAETNIDEKIEDLKMSKETDKKELSREEKKRLRRANMQEQGRLTLSDEFKEKGYRYRVCNVLPGNIENYKSQGYEVVTHPIQSGSGSLAHPEVDGNPTEFEVGGANGTMKAIWMRISEDEAQILDEIRDDLAKEQDVMIRKNPGIPQDQLTGKITKDNFK